MPARRRGLRGRLSLLFLDHGGERRRRRRAHPLSASSNSRRFETSARIDNHGRASQLVPLALLIAAMAAQAAEPPGLRAVMARAGAYVEKYQQDFSFLLADERYLQQVADATMAPAGGAKRGTGGGGAATETRVLVSEFALVRVEDADRTLWLAFRDVVDVGGQSLPACAPGR